MALNRREFIEVAAAMGASMAWCGSAKASRVPRREQDAALAYVHIGLCERRGAM